MNEIINATMEECKIASEQGWTQGVTAYKRRTNASFPDSIVALNAAMKIFNMEYLNGRQPPLRK